MVKTRTSEESGRKYVRGCLEAFLEGTQNLNWIMGVIRGSAVLEYEGRLREIFSDLGRYEKSARYQQIVRECEKEGWF